MRKGRGRGEEGKEEGWKRVGGKGGRELDEDRGGGGNRERKIENRRKKELKDGKHLLVQTEGVGLIMRER